MYLTYRPTYHARKCLSSISAPSSSLNSSKDAPYSLLTNLPYEIILKVRDMYQDP